MIHVAFAMALQARMRGALVGALVGDCLGAYWETQSWIGAHPIEMVRERIAEQVQQTKSGKGPVITYTDDTALTFAVAESLVECKGIDESNMARKMTTEYFNDPRRGYGRSSSTVFAKLMQSNFSDLHLPAREQFKGEGSCGNGSAMRISPGGLFGYNDEKTLIDVVTKSSRLTHNHISGVNGALLQAMAVRLALRTESSADPVLFVDNLLQQIMPFEEDIDPTESQSENGSETDTSVAVKASDMKVDTIKGQPTYTSRLRQIRALLQQQDPPSAHDVQKLLGHGILASQAVPCAIFAFLKCCGESFEALIPYAISLGGDTDTIASMAGAIGGAYWGLEAIPAEWVECCEESSRALSLADELFKIVMLQEQDTPK